MITIATPARIASAGLVFSPFVTTPPRPGPSISPAITTIESANRIVWLTERSSIRRASGSCTFVSTCRRVEPSAVRRLDRVRRHAADAERRDPDRRRDRVDHRRHDRRARADREQDHDRHQVGERGDDLHRVEHRRDRARGSGRSGRRAIPSGTPTASESAAAANMSANVCTASSQSPMRGERDERGERPPAPRAGRRSGARAARRATNVPTQVRSWKKRREPARRSRRGRSRTRSGS